MPRCKPQGGRLARSELAATRGSGERPRGLSSTRSPGNMSLLSGEKKKKKEPISLLPRKCHGRITPRGFCSVAAERQAPGERGRQAVVPHHTGMGPRPAAALGSKAEQRGPSHTALEKHMNNLAYSGKQAPPARRTPCSALSGAAAWLSLPTHAAAPPLPGHDLGTAQGVLAKLPPTPGFPCTPSTQPAPRASSAAAWAGLGGGDAPARRGGHLPSNA